MSLKYIVAVRNLFTFTTADVTLARILTQNVSLSTKIYVNIVAQSFTMVGYDLMFVKMVVGTSDPSDETNKVQNNLFRKILQSNCIKFTETPVIQIFNIETGSETPGALLIPYTTLLHNCIKILSVFDGEPAEGHILSVFFEVPVKQTRKATHILRNIFPEKLCINRKKI